MQLDVWIPKYNLALEYQGTYLLIRLPPPSSLLPPPSSLLPPPSSPSSSVLRPPSYPSSSSISILPPRPSSLFLSSSPCPPTNLTHKGEQHYFDLPIRDGPGGTVTVIARDQKKIEQCAQAGIILVHVPYWYERER
jgi:hypothetical protein